MRLEDVRLRYGRSGPWVLRGVTARLDPGEVAVVLGRNGAGKSTLLQLCAGVLRPARGRVVDRPRHVGWVPERFPADQPCTVTRYLTAMGRVAGLGRADTDRAVDRWTDRLGLTPFREVRLPDLSKGTAQKVGLAQAMLRTPGLLVLDEPWEGLDSAARGLVPELIDEVLADGGAVLVSDHRGETVRLPGARHWTVADGLVTEEAASGDGAVAVVEVAVPAARVAGTVARLRADGHHILRVREPATPPTPVLVPPTPVPSSSVADPSAGRPGAPATGGPAGAAEPSVGVPPPDSGSTVDPARSGRPGEVAR
ncbi:ABC transporter ATP-binding protein [Micromonospora antibiotica]|uniref:ABC transporter ATP-binding protein n=1 Tax=Micromonospora antibiotica TaxID=2807623 RepID=A0ABS3VAL0_9ACTN|nr:ABC transporter ATP-binding protein [Micromonospora antibiotica]MBO4162607.1 ABC transporter ATP-binding protein [Micromonospora antibiotica]